MAAVSSRTFVFLLSAICVLNIADLAIASRFKCSEKDGNYTRNSAYEENLKSVLSSLSTNITGIGNGFYNSSRGKNPDRVLAIALCRGDLKSDVCRSCFNFSTHFLAQRCPNQKGAIVWYDDCMLRYSSRNISNTMEDTPEFRLASDYNVSGDANVEYFTKELRNLLQNLSDRAAADHSLRKFATGNVPQSNFHTAIYALVQCTPDLSDQDCSHCLNGAIENFWKSYPGRSSGEMLRPSCNFRYETYPFYNLATYAPPPSLPPPTLPPPSLPSPPTLLRMGSHKSRTPMIIIVVASVVAFVVLATSIYIYLSVMKRREKLIFQSHSTKRTTLSKVPLTLPLSSKFHWDIFLSFRGTDTRKNFIDHLYSSLVRVGIRIFRDDEELPRGESISTELLNAIHGSRISIVVFSKDYASSRWCLDELVEIMGCRKFIGHTLLPIFYHIDPSDVRRQTGTFAEAFARHEERYQTNMVRVHRWREALTKAASCSGLDLESIANGYESRFIEKIVEKVLCMANVSTDQNVANI